MFDQNFAYHKIKSNADDSKNILENYVTERQLMVYRVYIKKVYSWKILAKLMSA